MVFKRIPNRRAAQTVAIIFTVLTAAALTLGYFLAPSRQRRAWARQAVTEITALASDPTRITRETAATPPAAVATQPAWIDDHIAFMRDGQFLIFKNECVHRHQFLGDIFIARGSDGRWYHSSFHFCCEMIVPRMEPQPTDLQTFISRYFLQPFDGNPDSPLAIQSTWNPGSSPIH